MNIYLRHLIIIAGFFSQFGFSASPFDGWTKSRYTVSFKSSDGDLHQMAQILNRKIGQRVGLTWQTQEHKLKMTFLPSLNKINIVGLMVAHGKENKITLSGRTYQGMTFTGAKDIGRHRKMVDIFVGRDGESCLFSLKAEKVIHHRVLLEVNGHAEFPCRGQQRPRPLEILRSQSIAFQNLDFRLKS